MVQPLVIIIPVVCISIVIIAFTLLNYFYGTRLVFDGSHVEWGEKAVMGEEVVAVVVVVIMEEEEEEEDVVVVEEEDVVVNTAENMESVSISDTAENMESVSISAAEISAA
jgi:hypothetical protein